MTLSTGGFRQVVAFPPAPIATGWSDPCRKGLAPSQEPCLSTAHDYAFGYNPPYALHPIVWALCQSSSCPGLSRASTFSLKLSKKDVDGRDRPGHDDR
jgi:hypothetical protein